MTTTGRSLGHVWSVLAVFLCTVLLRWPAFTESVRLLGMDATYHLLWTARVFEATPIDAHWLLPSVTRDPVVGDSIAWGAAVPIANGSLIYTSFPPLSFIAAWLAVGWLPPGQQFLALSLVNALVGLAAALLLGMLARDLARASVPSRPRSATGAFIAVATIYLLTQEALVSHGAVVWAHSLAQCCLFAGAFLFWRFLRGQWSRRSAMLLLVVAVAYPSLEWTGYIANAALVACLAGVGAYRPDRRRQALAIAGLVAAGTVGGLVLYLAHFGSVVGWDALAASLIDRGVSRFEGGLYLKLLPQRYLVSFGAIPLLALASLVLWAVRPAVFAGSDRKWLLLFSLAPMLENALMSFHAAVYSFDRLKLALPMTVVLVPTLMSMSIRRPILLWLASAAMIVSNVVLYVAHQQSKKDWGIIVEANRRHAAAFAKMPRAFCALVGTKEQPRGQLNLVFDRDIVGGVTPAQLDAIADRRGNCAVVYLVLDEPYPGMFAVRSIEWRQHL